MGGERWELEGVRAKQVKTFLTTGPISGTQRRAHQTKVCNGKKKVSATTTRKYWKTARQEARTTEMWG